MGGDVIDLLNGSKEFIRLRLSGIDVPEKKQRSATWQRRGCQTTLSTVAWRFPGHKRVQWGRLVGKVTVAGNDTNLQMVKRGLAWH